VGQTTKARLEGDTWFAEPKRFMWYLVLSCSVLWRLIYEHRQQKRYRHAGDSTDRDTDLRPTDRGSLEEAIAGFNSLTWH